MNKKLFISYSHKCFTDEVFTLVKDLEMKGYQVFYDKDVLKKGDWEKTIDNHIRACDYFIYMSSFASNSNEGFCLNELCRAGEFGKKIIPVLLDESLLPLSINKYQRLFFYNCFINNGIASINYEKFFNELIDALSDKEWGYTNDDLRLRKILALVSNRVELYNHYSSFCGRKKAFSDFEKFMNSDNNLLWIPSGPGSGKTAFASMLCWKYPEKIKAIHFCKFNNSDKMDPKKIFASIAYQLSDAIPAYKRKLLDLPELDKIFEKNATRIFEYLILDPLYDISYNENIGVVIDALDECTWGGKNDMANVLQRALSNKSLPKWLKFIVTSRDSIEISNPLKNYATISYSLEANNNEDILEYYKKEIEGLTDEKAEILLAKSEGSFLYAAEICKKIKENELDLNELDLFPIGIYGFFYDCFSRIFENNTTKDISFEIARPYLEILCVSNISMNIETVANILDYDLYKARNIVSTLASLFPLKNNLIQPLHKSLVDWLTSDDILQVYYIDKKNGYFRIYKYMKNIYDNKKYYNNLYVLENFASILIELEKYDELENLLNDLDYQKNVIQAMHFDSGLRRYLEQIQALDNYSHDKTIEVFNNNSFIQIFSLYRRLLYNSGMFFDLRNLGLTNVLARSIDYGMEGEIGKAFYYYIVEEFEKAIKKIKNIVKTEEINKYPYYLAELYNVKGLSERKLALFDDAIESFEKAIDYAKEDNFSCPNSEPNFELCMSNLILGKIYTTKCNFAKANRYYRNSLKAIEHQIEDTVDRDRKISDILFTAEIYRVYAYSKIWENEIDDAIDLLEQADKIYTNNKSTLDRYFVRFQYTSILLKIMQKDKLGNKEALLLLLNNGLNGKYDIGMVNYLLALNILINFNDDKDEIREGMKYANLAADTFFRIEALLEDNESRLILNLLSKKLGISKKLDIDDVEEIENWIEYIKNRIENLD